MPRLTLQALGRKLLDKRGNRGIRDVAQEIGISPATLSRVERGYLSDLETFGKICRLVIGGGAWAPPRWPAPGAGEEPPPAGA